jgi:hypothetical protein
MKLDVSSDWCWEKCGSCITLSEDSLVATMVNDSGGELATGGEPMTEGRHYWECEISCDQGFCADMMLGVVRPGHGDYDSSAVFNCGEGGSSDEDEVGIDISNNAYFIYGNDGSLHGNGKGDDDDHDDDDDDHGGFGDGDCIGCLLDLDVGWLRFYINGIRCGPGFTEGVTGPLLRAAEISNQGDTVEVLPEARAPSSAGAADEPWDRCPQMIEPESEPEEE